MKQQEIFNQRSRLIKLFVAIGLMIVVIMNVGYVLPAPSPGSVETSLPTETNSSVLTFKAEADAQVEEGNPTANAGTSPDLQVITIGGQSMESYIRFTVSGIAGANYNVRLRVYSTTDRAENGPALYATDNHWSETEITWENRPVRAGSEIGNQILVRRHSWVEYDVTALVTGDGTYSFVLVGDSEEDLRFSSRESSNGPELVITPASTASGSVSQGAPIATLTAIPTATTDPDSVNQSSSDGVILVGAGDIASCEREQDELTAALVDEIPGTVFTLGDNAYVDGSYTEYLNCYEPTWGRHKSRTKPIPGNHEYNTTGAAGYFQYFNNIPSYYAYDLGSWRIYALNSEIDVSASSPQVAWLVNDLAENPRQCVLAYWHKPRWSSGTNNGSEPALQTLWQILYDAGAELVITGHEHNYERFAEMDGSGTAVSEGLREIVVGTGGAGLYDFGTPLNASEVRDSSTFGVLKLTLNNTGYEWEFVPVLHSTFTDNGSDNCHS
jgi:hypothetical protein